MSITKTRLPKQAVFKMPDMSVVSSDTNWDAISASFRNAATDLYNEEVKADTQRATVAGQNSLEINANGEITRKAAPPNISTKDGQQVFENEQRAQALTAHKTAFRNRAEQYAIEAENAPNPIEYFAENIAAYGKEVEATANPDIRDMLLVDMHDVGESWINKLRQTVQTRQEAERKNSAEVSISGQISQIREILREGGDPSRSVMSLRTEIDAQVGARTLEPEEGTAFMEDLISALVVGEATRDLIQNNKNVPEIRKSFYEKLQGDESAFKNSFRIPEDLDVTDTMRAKIIAEVDEVINRQARSVQLAQEQRNKENTIKIGALNHAYSEALIAGNDIRDPKGFKNWMISRRYTKEQLSNTTGEDAQLASWYTAKIEQMVRLKASDQKEQMRVRQENLHMRMLQDPNNALEMAKRFIAANPDTIGNFALLRAAWEYESQKIANEAEQNEETILFELEQRLAAGKMNINDLTMLRVLAPGSAFNNAVLKNWGRLSTAAKLWDNIDGISRTDLEKARHQFSIRPGAFPLNDEGRNDAETLYRVEQKGNPEIFQDPRTKWRAHAQLTDMTGLMSKTAVGEFKQAASKYPNNIQESFQLAHVWEALNTGPNQHIVRDQLGIGISTRLDNLFNHFYNNRPDFAPDGSALEQSQRAWDTFIAKDLGLDPLYKTGSATFEDLQSKDSNFVQSTLEKAWANAYGKTGWGPKIRRTLFGGDGPSDTTKWLQGFNDTEQDVISRGFLEEFSALIFGRQNASFNSVDRQEFEKLYIENLKSTGMADLDKSVESALIQTVIQFRRNRNFNLSKYAFKSIDAGGGVGWMSHSPEFTLGTDRTDQMLKVHLDKIFTDQDFDQKVLAKLPIERKEGKFKYEEYDELIEQGLVRLMRDPTSSTNNPRWHIILLVPDPDKELNAGDLLLPYLTVLHGGRRVFSLEKLRQQDSPISPKLLRGTFTGGTREEWANEQNRVRDERAWIRKGAEGAKIGPPYSLGLSGVRDVLKDPPNKGEPLDPQLSTP